ncbi:MAG: hypothetical protein PHS14_11095, partial [Elusimicrobia bacterium]|nr:hypothetical protein [Elusimicrobiota bacterium]
MGLITNFLSSLGLTGDFGSAVLALLVFAAIVFIYNSIVVVGGTQIAVLERRWLGRSMPEGRVVAMANEVGIQARILGPGLHLLTPFLYRTEKAPMMVVAENEVGLIESIDGAPVPPGRIFGKALGNHNLFQDGEAFLTGGGEKGPQVQILPPGTYRVNPYLFKVVKRPALRITNNKIGVVVATDGQPITPGRLLGRSVKGHESFQNGQAFLEQGGQKGPQIDILLPGSYRVNTAMFSVEMREAVV